MSVISTRVDDHTKIEAEKIANAIGLPLSTAINVFLNRFVAEQGFPFDVTAPKKNATLFNKEKLESVLKESVKNRSDVAVPIPSIYIDSNGNKVSFVDD